MLISQNPDFFSFREIQIFFYFTKSRFRNFAKSIFRKIQLAASSLIESMSMPRSSITWIGPIVSSWVIGDPQIVNHDEEGAEICAALRFRWFSYNNVMQDMVHKANHISQNPVSR